MTFLRTTILATAAAALCCFTNNLNAYEAPSQAETAQTAPQTPPTNRWTDIEPSIVPFGARWVDIVQTRLPSIIARPSGPTVSSRILMLACIIIVIAFTLATIEFLFRRTID